MAIHREGKTFLTTAVVEVEPGARVTIVGGGPAPIRQGDVVILRGSPRRWRTVEVHEDDICWHARLRPAPALAVVAGVEVIEFWPRSTPYPAPPQRSTPPTAA